MKKIIVNILWLISEKLANAVGTLIITIYVARYLGPSNMGIINFSLAISTIIVPLSQLGADSLIFNRVAKNINSGVALLNATRYLRLSISISLVVFTLLAFYSNGIDKKNFIILLLMMCSCIFLSLDVYRHYFDALLKSKFNSIATQIGVYSSFILRFILVKIQAGSIFFTIPFIISALIPFIIRSIFYRKSIKQFSSPKNTRNKFYLKYIFFAGFPLTLSSLSIIFYTRVNQIILGQYTDMYSVGILNAAITLAQGWIFFPLAIITSFFAKIIKDNDSIRFKHGISLLLFIVSIISVFVILLFYYYSENIINLTYGKEYLPATEYLYLLSISSFFSIIGTIFYRTIVFSGGYKYIMIKMILMAIVNIILNLILIPQYYLYGAVIATLITEILSATLANIFFKKAYIIKIIIGSLTPLKYFSIRKNDDNN
ncbi:flippase [Proteus mirabilis]|uniref:flippase n=1 Tax=Proteus mirabilis TaxID=584 RepID=UPI001A2FBBA5|nr:flippase [Proteus mirabilis]EKU6442560.1 flippase [Proteus mirabilis]MBI6240172.1 flippase [Proteus mirabilis]MCI9738791.1 flippase [Proteus mirabilis]MCI9752200.1 flippase [Proteus mirabilis]MCI9763170.1 flippase [Proteus mirabilis]